MGKITHGKTRTRLYKIWLGIKTRCYNSKDESFKWYGNLGVTMCDEWRTNFESFYDWSMSHGYSENLTIDRISSTGNYEPNNCRWVTWKEQENNRCNNHRIEFNGEVHTLTEWSEILGISVKTLSRRIVDKKWPIARALTEPLHNEKSHQKNRQPT